MKTEEFQFRVDELPMFDDLTIPMKRPRNYATTMEDFQFHFSYEGKVGECFDDLAFEFTSFDPLNSKKIDIGREYKTEESPSDLDALLELNLNICGEQENIQSQVKTTGKRENSASRGASNDESRTAKKRKKWTNDEEGSLLRGISLNGNNWKLIEQLIPSRTYYQIKDKGRRLLRQHGWSTSRSFGMSMQTAKDIADQVMRKTMLPAM